jgi:MoaD family protein
MKVEVLLFGPPREAAGTEREVVSLKKGMRLSDLLEILSSRYGNELRSELGKKENLIIMVNGRHHSTLKEEETILKDKDTVAILPKMFGG